MTFTDLPLKEQETLALIADGRTTAEIADIRGVSMRTVANQCASLYLRIGVHNRVDATRWYLDEAFRDACTARFASVALG